MSNSLVRKPIFTVITPCLNAETRIEETVRSVLDQTALLNREVDLDYIIVDGGSTDRTLEIIERLNNGNIRVISEKDKGLYDAVKKGILLGRGDFFSYLNAGDIYSKSALKILHRIFAYSQVSWLSGLQVCINDELDIFHAELPFRFRSKYIQKGLYGPVLPFIQQESTFWKKDLNNLIDLDLFSKFRMAGDYFLWYSFSKCFQIQIVEAFLGAFRVHLDQMSTNKSFYFEEMKTILGSHPQKSFCFPIFDWLLWKAPNSLKHKLNPAIIAYNHFKKNWESKSGIGRVRPYEHVPDHPSGYPIS